MDLEEETLDESFFGKGIRELVEMFRDLGKVIRYSVNKEKGHYSQQIIEAGGGPSLEEEQQATYLWLNKGYIPIELYNQLISGWCNVNIERVRT